MVKIKKTKRKISKRLIITIALLVAFIGGGVAVYAQRGNANPVPETKPRSTSDGGTINYDPPTEEDRIETNNNKERIVEEDKRNQSQPQRTDTQKAVTPVITYAGQYGSQAEVGGYIPGIFELGGRCTATFTKGSATIKRSVAAVREGNAVDCPTLAVANNEFPEKGIWSVKLSYESSTASGSSDAKQIEIN